MTRKFNVSTYENYDWVCGCEETNRLYCFPCLLFAAEKDGTWTNMGFSDLGHLKQKLSKHEDSKVRARACVCVCVR